MKQGWLTKILPHIVAIVLFIVIAVIYCKPALDGQVLQQSDITGWKGAVQQSVEYGKSHDGQYPLWTNALFGGMPAFQVAVSSNNFIPGIVHTIMTLGLPAPVQFFFLACICFYILCMVLRINPWVAIIGSLGFAYATYNPVIISVGHITKMWTIAYMPALLASLILIYEKRYWLGTALTALFSSTLISMNHPQIAYYFFIAVGIMTIFYVINWIMAKEWKHMGMALAFTAVAAVTGVLTNAVTVMGTFEYQKETIRGGHSALTDTSAAAKNQPADGLDPDYALSYSVDIPEPLVMMIPRMYGGSGDKEEVSQEKSKAIEALRSMRQELGQQMPMLYYWGGIKDVGGFTFTSGPPYVGAIICFLALLSFFILDKKHKWWALGAIAFTIMMSWGSYFLGFNQFLFDNLPLYNKFRAPSMALVIPQLLLPMLAVLGVNAFVTTADKKTLWPKFKKGLIATAAVFVILFLLYMSLSYLTKSDSELLRQAKNSGQPEISGAVDSFFDGLKEDRKGLFMGDIWRSLGFILLAAATLFLVIRNTIKPVIASVILAALVFIDLITVDLKYLNKENYQDEMENESVFSLTAVDNAILADTAFYRVFNIAGDAYQENITSYHYNSIGGYHPAKLRVYQDMISNRISKEQSSLIQVLQTSPDSIGNVSTPSLNMLNTKYFIYKERGATKAQWQNKNALGNCWFVTTIQFVKDADAEMAALNSIDPASTAVVNESFKTSIPFTPQADSSASIRLIKNDNDIITYTSSAATNQFALFSEVYYAAGWKAFIDGKEAPVVKANYALRGLAIPAGQHSIEFKFEPSGYYKGKKITSVASIVLILLLAAGLFMEWRSRKKSAA
jgi:hypothetical protein